MMVAVKLTLCWQLLRTEGLPRVSQVGRMQLGFKGRAQHEKGQHICDVTRLVFPSLPASCLPGA